MAIKVSGSTVVDNNKVFLPNNTSGLGATTSISAGTLTLDLNTSTMFNVAFTSSITGITLSNVQSAGRISSFALMLTADGTARTVVWPTSFRWPGGTAPSITSTVNKVDTFMFYTVDGGTNWQAFISGQNL